MTKPKINFSTKLLGFMMLLSIGLSACDETKKVPVDPEPRPPPVITPVDPEPQPPTVITPVDPREFDPHSSKGKENLPKVIGLANSVYSTKQFQVAAYVENDLTIHQGDIIVPRMQTGPVVTTGAINYNTIWPNNVVPYEISPSLINQRALIEDAVASFNASVKTVRWIPRTTEESAIVFQEGAGGCNSYVGLVVGGDQPINLGKTCYRKDIVLHEMGHAVGLFHEQSRTDRDNFVNIIYDNINVEWRRQYDRHTDATPFGPYDFYSLMHYRMTDDGKTVITSKVPGIEVRRVGWALDFSATDVEAIRFMYSPIPDMRAKEEVIWQDGLVIGSVFTTKRRTFTATNSKGKICTARVKDIETKGHAFRYYPTGKYFPDRFEMYMDLTTLTGDANLYFQIYASTVDPSWTQAEVMRNCPYQRQNIIVDSSKSRN